MNTRKTCVLVVALGILVAVGCASRARVDDRPSVRRSPTNAASGFELDRGKSRTIPDDLSDLFAILSEAKVLFEKNFVPVHRTIKIEIDPLECFRTGYKFATGAIQFCAVEGVSNFGLNSASVIRHEAFHALFCAVRPEACSADVIKAPDIEALHEGLADYFAYQFAQNSQCFGEGFYLEKTCMRSYQSDLCFSLTEGPHGRGNAIVSALIAGKVALSELGIYSLKTLFSPGEILTRVGIKNACFATGGAPKIEIHVKNYPPSRLNKYWLKRDQPLQVDFLLNREAKSTYAGLTLNLSQKSGAPSELFKTRCEQSTLSCLIEVGEQAGSESLVAEYSHAGKVVGGVVLYLGVREE